ncbi:MULTISPECIES: Hsp70 family protein [unclassified Bradyrhizobium]|uniref:Hsp70 family protein n=1 Tax=unclassified Bradyrhizobium TaxID=2631580 RepID=UPI0028EC241E|nr:MULTISPECIES: Hsp70 family protein [unclassified Bradyrhizobium]
MVAAYCGIDFGTSNTTIGISDPEKARLLPLEDRHLTLPSAMFFDFEDHRTHFGRSAVDHYLKGHDGRFMRALKSILGTALIHEKTYIRQKAVPFSGILGLYFAHLKSQMERQLDREITEVVLGRPVRFVDKDDAADAEAQHALENIARAQGFRTIAFQYEPIAAALDYEQHVRGEELVLIADIGGGTSDFSIVRVSPERRKRAERAGDILANGGIHIGGTDFDRLLSLKSVMPELGYGSPTADGKRSLPSLYYHELATWHRINQLYKKNVMPELRQIRYEAARRDLVDRFIALVEARQGHAVAIGVEEAKIALTRAETAVSALADHGAWAKFSFTRPAFDAAIADAVERIVATVQRLLKDARVAATDVTTIFLTGGSSMVPLLRQAILAPFPGARVAETDLLGSVGIGLALDARRKFG